MGRPAFEGRIKMKCVNCRKRINPKTAMSFASETHETYLGRVTNKTKPDNEMWCCPNKKCIQTTYRKEMKLLILERIEEAQQYAKALTFMYRQYLTDPQGENYQYLKNKMELEDENPLTLTLFAKARVKIYQAILQDADAQEIGILLYKARKHSADATEEYHKCLPIMDTILGSQYFLDKEIDFSCL